MKIGVTVEMREKHLVWPEYEALDGSGIPYKREARVVGELPSREDRLKALATAKERVASAVGMQASKDLSFAQPLFVAFGMTRNQGKAHEMSTLLLAKGEELCLSYCVPAS